MTTMTWERAETASIDPQSYYLVQTNGAEWRNFDLAVMSGHLLRAHMLPNYVRGRPQWIAKVVRPTEATPAKPTKPTEWIPF